MQLQSGFSHIVQKKGFLVQKANVHTGSHAWSCMSNLMLLPEGEEKWCSHDSVFEN